VYSGAPTAGSFTLTFQGETTDPIPYGSDASVLQSELAALPAIGAGNIQVLNTTGTPTYFIWFQGPFASTTVPMISADGSGLTGGGIAAYGVIYDHGWKDTWGTESPAELAFAEAIFEQLRIIVEYALDTRPDVRLVLTDYDYMQEGAGGADGRRRTGTSQTAEQSNSNS